MPCVVGSFCVTLSEGPSDFLLISWCLMTSCNKMQQAAVNHKVSASAVGLASPASVAVASPCCVLHWKHTRIVKKGNWTWNSRPWFQTDKNHWSLSWDLIAGVKRPLVSFLQPALHLGWAPPCQQGFICKGQQHQSLSKKFGRLCRIGSNETNEAAFICIDHSHTRLCANFGQLGSCVDPSIIELLTPRSFAFIGWCFLCRFHLRLH